MSHYRYIRFMLENIPTFVILYGQDEVFHGQEAAYNRFRSQVTYCNFPKPDCLTRWIDVNLDTPAFTNELYH
jgi:hypothetical protein